MAFTLSAATTINGVLNSYTVTGTGNLDDLQTACSTIGMTKEREVYTFNPAVDRILAINGNLTETRDGTRTILITGGGHICFSYQAADTTTLGRYESTKGAYPSSVDVVYQGTALTLGADNHTNAQGKCFTGAGTFTFVSGSLSYDQTGVGHMDVWDSSTLASFDNVRLHMTANGSYTHIWKAAGKTVTTAKTAFIFLQRPMEGGATVTEVTPFYTDKGFRHLTPAGGAVLRLLQPSYYAADSNGSNATARIDCIDPATAYMGYTAPASPFATYTGIKRILRTLRVTWTDLLGAAIPSAKLVIRSSLAVITSDNFTAKVATKELLQSTRASGATHDEFGVLATGYTDEGVYAAYCVGYGYTAQYTGINVKTASLGNAGLPWLPASAKSSAIDGTAYASVVTAPFALDTGTNTLTVSSAATVQQASNYLHKLAFDNANAQYWIDRLHAPVALAGATLDFGVINITGLEYLTGNIKSTGTLTAGGAMAGLIVTGNVVQATPTSLTNVDISGTLTYNTASPASVTYTNVTTGTVSNSGAGAVSVKLVNSTITTGANVTSYIPTVINFSTGGGRILILDNVAAEQYNQTADALVELPASATGAWSYRICKFGQLPIEGTIAINGTTQTIAASYLPDGFVVDTEANVSAYTDLQTLQKIYDYESLALTTLTGIRVGKKLAKGFGTLSVTGGITTDPAAGAMFAYSGGVLTTKTSGLAEVGILFASGAFTQTTATLSNDVQIRSSNFDSEILYAADSITAFPTAGDRDANTNPGVTTTGGIYRYKYGHTYSGVTYTNPLNIRYTLGASIILGALPIVAGRYIFASNTNDLLVALGAAVAAVPADVLAALQATEIPVNLVRIKGEVFGGTGTEADPWGP